MELIAFGGPIALTKDALLVLFLPVGDLFVNPSVDGLVGHSWYKRKKPKSVHSEETYMLGGLDWNPHHALIGIRVLFVEPSGRIQLGKGVKGLAGTFGYRLSMLLRELSQNFWLLSLPSSFIRARCDDFNDACFFCGND